MDVKIFVVVVVFVLFLFFWWGGAHKGGDCLSVFAQKLRLGPGLVVSDLSWFSEEQRDEAEGEDLKSVDQRVGGSSSPVGGGGVRGATSATHLQGKNRNQSLPPTNCLSLQTDSTNQGDC